MGECDGTSGPAGRRVPRRHHPRREDRGDGQGPAEEDAARGERAKQIKILLDRLKSAEGRAEYGEKTVQKLNLRIDSIISDLVTEKMKTQNVNDEVDQTFELFVNH